MKTKVFEGKSVRQWIEEHPLLKEIIQTEEVFWTNSDYAAKGTNSVSAAKDIQDAAKRLDRFAPYIAKVFPETAEKNGIIESPLISIPNMQEQMEQNYGTAIDGKLLLKCDNDLPISGSIKARGGIYEVLKHAEKLALEHRLLTKIDDYEAFGSAEFKELFSKYSIAVGSTGNLGLSIGIIGARLGFKVTVHMSSDAKQWKKDLLRSKGVQVMEYQSDYSKAVEEGRKQAASDPMCHFIDDENSIDLFLGYSTAASRLKKQLDESGIIVDEDHPLFVYLPCGVGGGPGGVTFGLKQKFGEYVHCFFAEPTHSPCFLLGQMTGLQDKVSVQDFGIDNKTDADGLAVGRASALAGDRMGHLLSGCYTIEDARLYSFLRNVMDKENIFLEPSALAGFYGPIQLLSHHNGQRYLIENNLKDKMKNAHHIIWATGGGMVPEEVRTKYVNRIKKQ